MSIANRSASLKVLLARHGQSEANREQRVSGQIDTPLSEKGREQARCLREVLQAQALTAVYTSQLARAVETAYTTAQSHQLPVMRLSDLNEIHLGTLQGRALDGSDLDAEMELARWEQNKRTYSGNEVERYDRFEARVLRGLRTIEEAAAGTILIVGHRNTNEVLLKALLGSHALRLTSADLNIKNKYLYEITLAGTGFDLATIRLGGEHHGMRYEGWRQ
jgi:broad specificity phosphatase PhoE